MGVDFYKCKECGVIFPDCGPSAFCECGSHFCGECGEVERDDESCVVSCKYCRAESVSYESLCIYALRKLQKLGISKDELIAEALAAIKSGTL
jgi:hypothetical protein